MRVKLSYFYALIFTASAISIYVAFWGAKHLNEASIHASLSPSYNDFDISREKIILYWGSTIPKRCDYFTFTKTGPSFEDLNCPVNNCVWTDDKTKVKEADAVLFFDHCLGEVKPPERNPRGRWVFVDHESPCNSFRYLDKWDGLFNWTMTYTKDSDIFSPSLHFVNLPNHGDYPLLSRERSLSITRGKSKLVAWMVSHCTTHSRREEYVKELQKYIPVDVYGKCGPLVCKKGDTRCSEESLNNDYKFYLVFENSLAKDYVSEKFYTRLHLNVMLITRSGANFSRLGIPDALHIDTRDFKSPKDLAEYLKRLDKDDESYAALLRAKANHRYKILNSRYSYCDLCKKLNDPNEPRKSYSAAEIRNQHGFCVSPHNLRPRGRSRQPRGRHA
ncbi:alpha-(1,3)-fucosyltransferase C-like [Lingula anatina]|uniref:Fucosyltransferase n=1 Tax=Lingula anatina TaxID=7574 RepID=A0A1S3HH28_LINAN|nr:alpha-(1,3)-fucosyltransferase C-like [Lingula anatina]|eukprot:XP_013385388.1 alpha-(1,3)-fucosyltransferase C-like [Lingula anatina]